MSIVNYSDDKTLTIKYQDWHTKIDICKHPTCSCHDMTIEFYDSESSQSGSPNHSISFDVFEQKVVQQKKGLWATSNEESQFANAFLESLSEKDWLNIRKCFLDVKRHITNTASINDLNVSFPEKKIEKDGLMTGYHDIFPYAENIEMKIDDILYVLDDQYCLSSTCGCTGVGITFLARKNMTALNPRNSLFIIFDYKKNSYEIVNRGAKNIDPPQLLVKEIIRNRFGEIFKNRHKKLRTLYDNFRKKKRGGRQANSMIISKPNGEAKTGRNSPCPCGSGKKYKKCCM